MYIGQEQGQISAAVAERLMSLIGQRVSIPIAPLPGEGLADVIYRAACVNGYKTVWELFGERGSFSHSAFAVNHPDLPGLADLLGTPTGDADLAPLRYQRSPGEVGRVDFFGASLPGRQFIGRRRISPIALRASPHSKAIWHLTAINFDPHNYESLLDKCPVCQTGLNFRHTTGVCHCHRCGPAVDLRDFEQPKIAIADEEALDFVTGLVDPERAAGKSAVSLLHSDLQYENPGHIFTLCVLIGAALENRQRKSGRRLISGTEVTPQSLISAARAIRNWPDGLVEILSEQGLFRSATESGEAHSFAGLCKHGGVLNGSLMNAVQKVVMLSRLGEKQPPFLRRLEVVTDDLAQDRGSEIAKFTAVANTGPFRRAVSASKLPPIVLYNCYLSGLCGPPSERLEIIGPQVLAWSSSLKFDHVPTTSHLKSALPLFRCVNVLFQNGGDVWAIVIRALLDGALPIKRMAKLGDGLNSLYVADFAAWRTFLENTEGITDCADFPLTSPELAFYLNMSLGAAQTMFNLTKITTHTDLKAFMRDFVFLADLSDLATMRGRHLNREALWRGLNEAGLRSTGDRVVPRAAALRHLKLDYPRI